MNTYFLIKDNTVVNVFVWDGVSDWTPPDGTTAELALPGIGVGWTRVDGNWIAPTPSSVEPVDESRTSALAKLAALGLTEEEIAALIR
jgi:hypothetical protein